MGAIKSNNPFYRLLWSIGHTPLRFVEFVEFALIGWVLVQTLIGFGGFLAYGRPMIGVSFSLILLGLLHALMLILRKDRPGIDWILLVPVPFLIYSWIHYQFISPYPWNAAPLLSVYLQCYVLYMIVYNSIHGVHSAKWMIGLLQIPVLFAVVVAFLRFYLFPLWIQDGSRIPDPAYGFGAGGFFQDPVNLGSLIVGLLPVMLLSIYKHRFNGPVMIYYCSIVALLIIAMIMSTNLWGLVTMFLILVVLPFFISAKWRVRGKFWKWVLIILPFAVFFLWFGTDLARERLAYILLAGDDPAGHASREVGLAAFNSEMLTGIGMGGYPETWDKFAADGGELYSWHAIGSYHELLAETGILGMLMLFGTAFVVIGWGFLKWKDLQFIRLNHEAADRLKSFPGNHPIHKRLRREKGRMPTRKAALGGLMVGILAILAYAGRDFSLKMPVVLFYLSCMAGSLVAFARGYECHCNRKIWILAAVLPFAIAVWAAIIGSPMHYSNYLTFIASEELNKLKENPDQVFQSQMDLNHVQSDLELAINLAPDNGRAWVMLATAMLMRVEAELETPGNVARNAMPAVEKGLELFPGSWEIQYDAALAKILMGGQDKAAIDHLSRARELAPSRREPAALQGSLLLLSDPSSPQGRQLLEKVLDADPDYAAARSVLRRADMQTGHSGDSIFTKASMARQFMLLPQRQNRVNAAGLPKPD